MRCLMIPFPTMILKTLIVTLLLPSSSAAVIASSKEQPGFWTTNPCHLYIVGQESPEVANCIDLTWVGVDSDDSNFFYDV